MPQANSVDHAIGGKRSSLGVDWRITELAEVQHGVVARRQLEARGIGSRAVEVRLGSGTLHRVHRGVYSVGHRNLGVDARRMAAVLACGDGAALSHRSAAGVWGLLRGWAGAIEVTRQRGWRAPTAVRARQSPLRGDEIAVVDGIPVTGLARTLFDLAAVLSRRQVERAMNEAEVRGLTDRVSVPDLLLRYPRKKGAATLRSILAGEAALLGAVENDFEADFAALVRAYGLPRPRFNADLMAGGRFLRPDALWEEERVIVELDGRAAHGTARAFESDRERDRILLADGWRVVRVTWKQLRAEPERLAADLRKVLAGPSASTL